MFQDWFNGNGTDKTKPKIQIIAHASNTEVPAIQLTISDGLKRTPFAALNGIKYSSWFGTKLLKYTVIEVNSFCLQVTNGKKLLYLDEISIDGIRQPLKLIGAPVLLEQSLLMAVTPSSSSSNSSVTSIPVSTLTSSISALTPVISSGKRQVPPIGNSIALLSFNQIFPIRGRCIIKKDLYEYTDRYSTTVRVFSFILQDESGFITIAAYDNNATTFFNKIHEGSVYTVANFKVEEKDKFSNCTSAYQLKLLNTSRVMTWAANFPTFDDIYKFTPTKQILDLTRNEMKISKSN